jgi:hypothetical protein
VDAVHPPHPRKQERKLRFLRSSITPFQPHFVGLKWHKKALHAAPFCALSNCVKKVQIYLKMRFLV